MLHRSRDFMYQFQPGQRVMYVPNHAHDDLNHPDIELGTITRINKETIFVQFDRDVETIGQEAISKGCYPHNLRPFDSHHTKWG